MPLDNEQEKNMTSENSPPLSNNSELYQQLNKALIEHCRQDGDEASEILSVKLSNINSQLNSLKIKIDEGMDAETMKANVQTALSEVVQAFMQLQFFDRVSQRLEHAALATDYSNNSSLPPSTPIESHFTMEDERILYNALQDGADINEAVAKASNKLDDTLDKSDGDDIELF